MIAEIVKTSPSYVIYGAQVIAFGAYTALYHLTGRKPACFAVGSLQGNPGEIEGIPVRMIDEVPKDTLIVVGVTELVQKEVLPFLKENGFEKVFPLTQHEEHLLMAAYYQSIGKFPLVNSKDSLVQSVQNKEL